MSFLKCRSGADHDVYITDWHNARDVALSEGSFGFDDFIQHLIDFLDTIGPALMWWRSVTVRRGACRHRRDGTIATRSTAAQQ